ncbi:hypothetical protein GGR08_000581 [Bartonella fuyuanensis]|uniref:Uncharacterized protein n=1 Tax=Bartonella fuyuanensis TaxID=1460968 RepID=A0A840DX37_9HYPH|nr:hypothetical protein [Bartonella fuyuanensis]MBB4076279.1 hypothetical protein [Bartonella fuyuanensis]MBB4076288.1 hypothetical protein [Bartonella fuyuanensis]
MAIRHGFIVLPFMGIGVKWVWGPDVSLKKTGE